MPSGKIGENTPIPAKSRSPFPLQQQRIMITNSFLARLEYKELTKAA